MSSRAFAEWMAFDRLEPIGEGRADLRAGIIASTVFNMNRGKDTPARSPSDYMPTFTQEERDERKAAREAAENSELSKKILSAFKAYDKRARAKATEGN